MKLNVIDYNVTQLDEKYNWGIIDEESTDYEITVVEDPQEEDIITALIEVGYISDDMTVGEFGIEWITDGIYDVYLSENYKPVCRLETEDGTY